MPRLPSKVYQDAAKVITPDHVVIDHFGSVKHSIDAKGAWVEATVYVTAEQAAQVSAEADESEATQP